MIFNESENCSHQDVLVTSVPAGRNHNANEKSLPKVYQSESESSSSFSHDIEDVAIEAKETTEVIHGDETKSVNRSKIVVVFIVFSICVVAVTCVNITIRQSENAQFEDKFNKDAAVLMDGLGMAVARSLNPIDGLARSVVSHARFANATWPFVTLPDFALKLSKILPFTDAIVVTIYPLVQPKQKSEWEQYSSENIAWVNESIAMQATWEKFTNPILYDWTPYSSIYDNDGDVPQNISRMMAPSWQVYPVIPRYTPYNWDGLSTVDPSSLYACINSHKVVLSEPYMVPRPDNPEIQAESEEWIEYYRDFIPAGEEPFEPLFDVTYPIIDDLSRVELSSAPDYVAEDHKLVGYIAMSIYWRRFFENVLAPTSNGIIVNITSSCSVSFAYQIHGPNATYIGIDDTSNKKYDHLTLSADLVGIGKSKIVNSLYSGAPINEAYCPYIVYIYPSDKMKEDMTSNNAAIYSVVTCAVFVCIGLAFLVYDSKVERRQKNLMSSAVRSSEIVSSLFPSSVHDQIYATMTSNTDHQTSSLQDAPIATLYTDTTVMFGDIKGFTAWSSSRSPAHVFQLLESLYGEFDKLAERYGVFKVETVGDSYVAVVGLPKPRKNHALVMSKFAMMCIERMTKVTKDLEDDLGMDTSELLLRVGLHSGPTTAGVLRGHKARFQIFGDTVNTASRMESTGEGNKIQVSEATAELLIAANKSNWLTKRVDLIEAKGKGLMQTYWCEPGSRDLSTTKRSSISIDSKDS